MILIYYINKETYTVDPKTEWFNYNEYKLVNAVLVNNSNEYFDSSNKLKGEKINTKLEDNILQYYVYISRYEYKLFSYASFRVVLSAQNCND